MHIKKLHPDAIIPAYGHADDAGFDLCAIETVTIAPGERATVGAGFAIAIPEGYVGLVWDKSSVSHKLGLKTMGGVFDAGYRGEINTCLYNTGDEPVAIEKGQKMAQMLIQKVEHVTFEEVAELDETPRGDGRFGSTGK